MHLADTAMRERVGSMLRITRDRGAPIALTADEARAMLAAMCEDRARSETCLAGALSECPATAVMAKAAAAAIAALDAVLTCGAEMEWLRLRLSTAKTDIGRRWEMLAAVEPESVPSWDE
jgi:hypothetical protein